MSKYATLTVDKVIKETEEAVTIVFQMPNKKIEYKPGQFLTLMVPVNGNTHRRSYSLSSSPYADKNLAVTVKRIPDGLISAYLVGHTRSGQNMEVMLPAGNFTIACHPKNERNIILIGAGSGITPLISMAKSVLAAEARSKVFLVYGNRNENTIILKSTLEQLTKEYKNRFHITHVLSQPLGKAAMQAGRLNQSSLIKILENFPGFDKSTTEYYLCGPHGLMEEANKALEILNIDKSKIHKEDFISTPKEVEDAEVQVGGGDSNAEEVTILYQGSEYKFQVPKGKTILEAALDENIDLPYSCQSGMCTACMGKCTHGKVKLNDPDGLSDKEIQQGYVLTCVGQPASAGVVIEID